MVDTKYEFISKCNRPIAALISTYRRGTDQTQKQPNTEKGKEVSLFEADGDAVDAASTWTD